MDQRTRAEGIAIPQITFFLNANRMTLLWPTCGLIEIFQCNPARSFKLIIFMPNSKPYQTRGTINALDPNGKEVSSFEEEPSNCWHLRWSS
jgi:hypothetical protein